MSLLNFWKRKPQKPEPAMTISLELSPGVAPVINWKFTSNFPVAVQALAEFFISLKGGKIVDNMIHSVFDSHQEIAQKGFSIVTKVVEGNEPVVASTDFMSKINQ